MTRTAKKRANLALVDTKAEPESEEQPEQPMAEQLTVQLNLVFTVDGKPVVSNPVRFQLPKPGADVDSVTLQVALDGRVLLRLLEPALGPQKPDPALLWTPRGAPPRLKKD